MREGGGFFSPGGTLPPGAASYVIRDADREIEVALTSGEFVFVLDSRQKGKSSLIVHALERMNQRGIVTLRLDLQRLGTNLQPEQWYASLLHSIGQELGLTAALLEYWKSHVEIGPMTRWFLALEHIVLPAVECPLVIFIDEIDFVQALPFSSDEFFAGIRGCHNRRADTEAFSRLTFCLVGVATPSQLINNQDVTPFNVGRRIELTDFTRRETEPYAAEISSHGRDGPGIVDRIHYWVNGHPYLTQLLASRVVIDPGVVTASDVDALVRRTLLSAEARQREPNLADAERRLLEASFPGESREESRSRILDLHRLLLRGELVPANHEEPLVLAILLSGIAVEEAGRLRIRNRLYRTLFNERWRRNNLPDSEARRMRLASVRAAWKVASASLVLLALISSVAVWLLALVNARNEALSQSRRLALENSKIAYRSSMALASVRFAEGSLRQGLDLVKSQQDSKERGWEWDYLRYAIAEPTMVRPPLGNVQPLTAAYRSWLEGDSVAETRDDRFYYRNRIEADLNFPQMAKSMSSWLIATRDRAPFEERLRFARSIFDVPGFAAMGLTLDRRLVATVGPNSRLVTITDRSTGKKTELRAPAEVARLNFSASGRFLHVTCDRQWFTCDLQSGKWFPFMGMESPDDHFAVTGELANPTVFLRRMSDGSIVRRLDGHSGPGYDSAWFSDSRRLVTAALDGTIRIWDVFAGKELLVYTSSQPGSGISISANEREILFLTRDGAVYSAPVHREAFALTLPLHRKEAGSIVLSPDGSRGITTSPEGTSKLLDMRSLKVLATYHIGYYFEALPTVFAPDGKTLALVFADGTLTLADPLNGRVRRKLKLSGKHPYRLDISRTGQAFIALREGGLLSMQSLDAPLEACSNFSEKYSRVAVSPDGALFALGTEKGGVVIVDAKLVKPLRRLTPSTQYITGVEFAPNGRWLSASSRDGRGYLFALDGSGREKTLYGHGVRIWQARFSPDSRYVLSTSYDGGPRVWETETGNPVSVMRHDSWVGAAEWSPDSRRVVTACGDGHIRIFDPLSGFELLKLGGHKGHALDVLFTPDGKDVVSSGVDGTVRIWRSEPSARPAPESG